MVLLAVRSARLNLERVVKVNIVVIEETVLSTIASVWKVMSWIG